MEHFFIFILLFFFPLIIFADVPPEGEILLIHEVDAGEPGHRINPFGFQEARSVVVAPNTILEDNTPATWVIWEKVMSDRQIYSHYFHSFYNIWAGPDQVSQASVDAGKPAMCVTENGRIHCVYHGDHDATGAYEIGYSNHCGLAFNSWNWQEVISVNENEGWFPTIISDGNDIWVSYWRFWQAPTQELCLQHGVWNEETESMTWWNPEEIQVIAQSTTNWPSASLFPDNLGKIHITYGNSNEALAYKVFDPAIDNFISEEEVINEPPEQGKCYSPSLVVNSQRQVHITYPYTFHDSQEDGNLGTVNYVHGTSGNWSQTEHLQYRNENEETVVDSFCTLPVIGIDENDGLWVTYTCFKNYDTEDEIADLMLKYKSADGEWWDGINYTENFDKVPRYPSLNQQIPLTGPNLIFSSFYPEPYAHKLYCVEAMDVPESTIKDKNLSDIPPSKLELSQNYPNPFNPTTTISYQLPKADKVKLSIYNSSGQLLEVLIDKKQEAGYHSLEWDAKDVASGMYFYRIETRSGFEEVRKCVVLK